MKQIVCCVALTLSVCSAALGSAADEDVSGDRAPGRIHFLRNKSCTEPYRQFAASPPLQGTSDGGEGFPWRFLYGYCVAQFGRLLLHQDWVLSYLDANPQRDAPGGNGVSFGTDLGFQWRRERNGSITPYYELGFGIQYAAGTAFPAHGSRWMLVTNAGVGLLLPLRPTLQLNTAIRYLHLSNAGLLSGNAGYDAFHVVIGVRW